MQPCEDLQLMFTCELQTIRHGLPAPKKQKGLPEAKKADKAPKAKAAPAAKHMEAGGGDGAAAAPEMDWVSIPWITVPHLHSRRLNVQCLRRALFSSRQWDMNSRGMNY